MQKKNRLGIIVLFIIIISLAACGGDDNAVNDQASVNTIGTYISDNQVKISIPESFYGKIKYAIITNRNKQTEIINLSDKRIVEFTMQLHDIEIEENNFTVTIYDENDEPLGESVSL